MERPDRAVARALVTSALVLVAACGSEAGSSTTGGAVATVAPVATAAPVATGGVPTTVLATTVPAGPAVGALAAPIDALAELQALPIATEPYAGPADEYAHAIADQLLATFGECDVTPSAMVSTVGESPAVATIDVTSGCDDAIGGAVYTVTLDDPDGEGYLVFAASRESRCLRGVDGALCV